MPDVQIGRLIRLREGSGGTAVRLIIRNAAGEILGIIS
jgi:hypothetical protein